MADLGYFLPAVRVAPLHLWAYPAKIGFSKASFTFNPCARTRQSRVHDCLATTACTHQARTGVGFDDWDSDDISDTRDTVRRKTPCRNKLYTYTFHSIAVDGAPLLHYDLSLHLFARTACVRSLNMPLLQHACAATSRPPPPFRLVLL